MFVVDTVPVDEAADTAHGPSGIGEWMRGAEVQVIKLHRKEKKTQLMTTKKYIQRLHLQDKKGAQRKTHIAADPLNRSSFLEVHSYVMLYTDA